MIEVLLKTFMFHMRVVNYSIMVVPGIPPQCECANFRDSRVGVTTDCPAPWARKVTAVGKRSAVRRKRRPRWSETRTPSPMGAAECRFLCRPYGTCYYMLLPDRGLRLPLRGCAYPRLLSFAAAPLDCRCLYPHVQCRHWPENKWQLYATVMTITHLHE